MRPARRQIALCCALALLAGCGDGLGDEGPAPRVGRKAGDEQAAQRLGFPAFATKNTTRVGGADPVADAAGVALAVYPSVGGVERPKAVTVVEAGDWRSAIAASVLAGEPLRTPILLSGREDVPRATREALEALRPRGTAQAGDAQVIRVGDAVSPLGLRTRRIGAIPAGDVAALAAEIDRFQAGAAGRRSDRVLVVSQNDPAYAMPAAGWAAKSGDPILFVRRAFVPAATRAALRRHRSATVYVLGPPSVVSRRTVRQLRRLARSVKRISGRDPVESAIVFARYLDGRFGWNVNDPGHGLVIASTNRPADAAAAALLSASGKYGPLLVTDDPLRLPAALEQFLLDIKPGYRDDPSRAVYNHAWLIGDAGAIDIGVQAQIDELAEVTKIRPAPGR